MTYKQAIIFIEQGYKFKENLGGYFLHNEGTDTVMPLHGVVGAALERRGYVPEKPW